MTAQLVLYKVLHLTRVTGNITSTVTRTLKLFRINDGAWSYVQDLTPGALI